MKFNFIFDKVPELMETPGVERAMLGFTKRFLIPFKFSRATNTGCVFSSRYNQLRDCVVYISNLTIHPESFLRYFLNTFSSFALQTILKRVQFISMLVEMFP